MSPHLNHKTRTTANRRPSVKERAGHVAAALGVCIAATTAVALSGAHLNQRPAEQHGGPVSAQQIAREIRVLEAKGYVPTACTINGTLMRNYHTGQSVTVKL
jgi:hypothetical protein